MEFREVVLNNPCVLLDRVKTKAFISDCYVNNRSEINALMNAYDMGIVTKIIRSYPFDNFFKNNTVNILTTQYSMFEKMAEWVVDIWISIITTDVIKALDDVPVREDKATKKLFLNTSEHDIFINELTTRQDINDYYINVSMIKQKGKVYIPCGVRNTDNGFFICGIAEEKRCLHKFANVYVLIYNYILRNSISKEPIYLRDVQTIYTIDYYKIFRLEVIILQLIKNNYFKDSNLDIQCYGSQDELKYAVEIINNYAAIFCRLIGIVLYEPLKIQPTIEAILIGETSFNGIYIEQNKTPCNAHEMWFGQKINYHLTNDNIKDLEYILREISPFDGFKEGQFDALSSMLASDNHSICLMPTGSGKSLIFFLASLLQPLPVFVVSPTEILIHDQMRNLLKFHQIDNVSHLKLLSNNDFSNFEIYNSLLYLTPSTFQNRNLLTKFRHINDDKHISYIVLDEIHCLSNWGHDFRPEYLMLSKFLNKFLDNSTFLGFTATANFTVVEDIQKQLKIPQRNIFSPISFDKYNISYDFRSVETTEEMYAVTYAIVSELKKKNERTIIFTKNDIISLCLAENIGSEADVFQSNNTDAYQLFVDEKCLILVTSEELGIGINFTNIKNIIHFGLPVSKNEYVQEVGRAGRSNEFVKSFIVYLKTTPANVPQILLKRDIEIENITQILNNMNNDYSNAYRKINNNIDSKEVLIRKITEIYNDFKKDDKPLFVKKYLNSSVETIKKYIYMLYVIGFVNDWYSDSADEKNETINIMIVISSTNHKYFLIYTNLLNRVKNSIIEYMDFIGNNLEFIAKIRKVSTIEEVITIYSDWYYYKFLYHNKEMFLDLLLFVENNLKSNNEKITNEIKDYFVLPFLKIKNDEVYYYNLPLQEIVNKVIQGISRGTLVNIERLNSNKYSYNLDFFILLGTLKIYGRFDGSRLDRIISNSSISEKKEILSAIAKVFSFCDENTRFTILQNFESRVFQFDISLIEFCDYIYAPLDKDILYYGILSIYKNIQYKAYIGSNRLC